ncbi:CapA family protein [Desmospora profundinema]|uniref:Poly-gamma-glutamate synthesis protein (Capsule biosynthesis protein) n=1 Tax=Desmospora profundinema TaxID=1571184 RepID=A0ABU1IPR5_9BACL|nr:CapA family protein [Desmospora profundinema]MDR6226398.1 poly-gamma-glutamate synthesis protein (capsule biosynthesis protein) [Desmospora profundinema]
MSKKLNRKQRMLRWTKKHKVKAPLHTTIALIVSVILLAVFSLADTFAGNTVEADPATKESEDLLTMTMVGDMMFGRYVGKAGERNGYDHLFNRVQPYFNESDLVTGNVASPILKGNPEDYPKEGNKENRLHARDEAAVGIKKAGFSSVNLANNYTMNYGAPGLLDTISTFRDLDLPTVGAGSDRYDSRRVLYQNVNGIKVATLGVTDVWEAGTTVKRDFPGVVPARPQTILPLIEKARKNADLVVVHVHWGVEYDNNVHPRQRDLGRAMVDAGADIIIGHHPHVLEPIELYKDSVILYSLGNFIFDQGWSRTRETALVQYKLGSDGKARLEVHPMLIREGQPRPLTGVLNGYRREKIYLQLADEIIYNEGWKKKWTREKDYIYHEWDHSKVLKNGESGGAEEADQLESDETGTQQESPLEQQPGLDQPQDQQSTGETGMEP